MTAVSTPAVVAQIQALEATLGSLGQSLDAAAPSGGFAGVLESVQAEMAGIGASPASAPAPTTSAASGGYSPSPASSTAFVATANVLGGIGGSSDLGLPGAWSAGGGVLAASGFGTGASTAVPGPAGSPGAVAGGAGGSIPASLGVPAALAALFEQASSRYDVPAALLAAVAKQESGFDPSAVSSAGAEGLMQLMPSTAAGLGVDAFDPQQAVDGAASLLSSYLKSYGGSVPLTLAAYNAGPGAVAQYGGVPPYSQTQNYVRSIMASLGMAP